MTRKSDRWVILGKPVCQWCHKACDLLARYGIEYKYYDLVTNEELRAFVLNCGLTSVPQVYLNGQRLGGFEELSQYLSLVYKGEDDRQLQLPF